MGCLKFKYQKKTYINEDYIKAIESGDYSIFPSKIFALRYFEKYSMFLGINQEFFDIYDADNIIDDSANIKKNWIQDFYPQIKIAAALAMLLILTFIFINKWSQPSVSTEMINLPAKNKKEIFEIPSENDQKLIDDALMLANSFVLPQITQTEESMLREFSVSEGVINNLSLRFLKESWVEIYQGNNQLIYKLFKTGESLDISITPPFKIIAGNAGGIVGMYNQNEINFTQAANKLNVSSIEIDNE
ncbi:helix-turn-helix domain-containing protein [Gammaproteobacteria bacterium]|nr:helix-turn-helix domain-containing protein [Gammaproteobacteria bacterium]